MAVFQRLMHLYACWVKPSHPPLCSELGSAFLFFPGASLSFSQLDFCQVPEPGNIGMTGKPLLRASVPSATSYQL